MKCRDCPGGAEPGRVRCAGCLARRAAEVRRLRAARAAVRVCLYCTNPAVASQTCCDDHRALLAVRRRHPDRRAVQRACEDRRAADRQFAKLVAAALTPGARIALERLRREILARGEG